MEYTHAYMHTLYEYLAYVLFVCVTHCIRIASTCMYELLMLLSTECIKLITEIPSTPNAITAITTITTAVTHITASTTVTTATIVTSSSVGVTTAVQITSSQDSAGIIIRNK